MIAKQDKVTHKYRNVYTDKNCADTEGMGTFNFGYKDPSSNPEALGILFVVHVLPEVQIGYTCLL